MAHARKKWRPDEDAKLRVLVKETKSPTEIGNQLGRLASSVLARMNKLNLSFEEKETTPSSTGGTIMHPKPGVLVHYANYTSR